MFKIPVDNCVLNCDSFQLSEKSNIACMAAPGQLRVRPGRVDVQLHRLRVRRPARVRHHPQLDVSEVESPIR